MRTLSLKDVAAAVGGRLIGENKSITSVCTDTRKLSTGCLFIAIRGEKFDGHSFVESAYKLGAVGAIVSHLCNTSITQIVVDNTRTAYLALAAWYRSTFNIPVVGVTGSVGKTSTREMIAAALDVKYNVHKNEGNLNNDIGLPATVMTLTDSYTCAVYEMGMSHFGEIRALSRTIMPDIGIITNIGVSHIENLGSRENILAAKLEILEGMKEKAPLVVNVDNDLLAGLQYSNTVTYGINSKADYTAENIEQSDTCVKFICVHGNERTMVTLPVVGKHHVYNALAAIAVAGLLNVGVKDAVQGLSAYHNTCMRQQIEMLGTVTLIEDCYNASPDSMKVGLDTLTNIAKHRRIAVLGDMMELGEYADEAHRMVGEYAATCADLVLTCGRYASLISEFASTNGARVLHFENKNELADCLADLLSDGDTVLFKASRAMKFEDIIDKIKGVCDCE